MAEPTWHGDELERRFRSALLVGITNGIGIVENEAVRLILSPPKTGRVYRRGGVEHQASAAGEAPASDTGRLAASRSIELDAEKFRADLIFRTEYALMLEVGTVKMAPRPFGRPALANTQQAVIEAVVTPLRSLPQ